MIVLIPAYEPTNKMINLIKNLKDKCDYDILIVDDGSGNDYKIVFDIAREMGCLVITGEVNKGKGSALKLGFEFIKSLGNNQGIVTADCDGQHLPEDIIKVAEAIDENSNKIILGSRKFKGNVPFRSRFGNSITRNVFTFASGVKIYDTQTGLRGFNYSMLNWLCHIPGHRFEYEMNQLLEANFAGYDFKEIDIDTVYLEENKSSHFRTIQDSAQVYYPIIKFSLSSILSAVLDFTLVILLQLLTSNLFLAVVGARVCSGIFNYTMNNLYVFSKFKNSSIKKSLPRYFILAFFIMLANYGIIHIFNETLGVNLFMSKLMAEVSIFSFSFWAQRKFVFTNNNDDCYTKISHIN
ncbi:bifunctional glycosyltransferase family 2/GtrA family protein [Clostridium grantii]|uniref:Putative flippase GtrA (Transmembrane translocase of bactoprenol-linked glucose) n=1 Tax=Clostridium grantii DSM 8605 TaxID=1121316 RepID=A0A1M5T5W6_9CLOT|nr:bifunctional glycosyltransferase family 2/GtrA family protein [Clostridium grantii]SHH46124.1 Putative flippase GtrA (transmembrane translocase of bactoprenol-linked glucose) [Clostridium grantii DSM 8605]